MTKIIAIALIFVITASNSFSQKMDKETFVLYSYHYHVPFLIDLEKRKGLTFELIDFLNSLDTQYNFEVVFKPRSRLETKGKIVNKPILWTSPVWFKDKQETKYKWTKALLHDKDVFVSKMKFEYKSLESLTNLKVIMPRGFYFYGVTEMAKNKKISPIYVENERQSLKMIIQGRGDVAIIGHSMLTNLFDHDLKESRNILRISKHPHDEFDRRILFPKKFKKQFKSINDQLKKPKIIKKWKSIIKKYKLKL